MVCYVQPMADNDMLCAETADNDMLCVNTQKTQQGALLSTEKYCIECSVLQEILYASEAPHSKTGLFGGAFGCSFCKIYSSTAVYS